MGLLRYLEWNLVHELLLSLLMWWWSVLLLIRDLILGHLFGYSLTDLLLKHRSLWLLSPLFWVDGVLGHCKNILNAHLRKYVTLVDDRVIHLFGGFRIVLDEPYLVLERWLSSLDSCQRGLLCRSESRLTPWLSSLRVLRFLFRNDGFFLGGNIHELRRSVHDTGCVFYDFRWGRGIIVIDLYRLKHTGC